MRVMDEKKEKALEILKKKKQCSEIINELLEKYSNDDYMLTKTHNYICNQLPTFIDNIKRSHEERMVRLETMNNDKDLFIEYFLCTNRYFYVSVTEKYFYYDGLHYRLSKEDDILYNVWDSISKDGTLNSWKQRTKTNIMKRIKDSILLKSIPESYTIQFVLDLLYPTIFSTKIEAKYFLTIIGDNILKKNSNIIHYINTNAKHFIRELNIITQSVVNLGCSQTFKFKYHEHHSYNDCRLLNINDCIKSEAIWSNILNNYALDLICVASHYSLRYKCSDNVILNNSNDSELNNKIFYLKNTNSEIIVDNFIGEYLQIIHINENQNNIGNTQISWKNMHYLWKQFLSSKNLPNIMFQQTLKTLLIEKIKTNYNEEHDIFTNICSKKLPDIQKFLKFWDENIENDDNEMNFEIEEIIFLFRTWCNFKKETMPSLNDKQLLDLISYYYPNIEIEKNKYICKIKCSLWDKQMDIQLALESMKESITSDYYKNINNSYNESTNNFFTHLNIYNGTPPTEAVPPEIQVQPLPTNELILHRLKSRNISIYDAYDYYCKFYSAPEKQIVNKNYFEKYIFENLTEYIIDSKFISGEWLLTE